MYFEYRFRDEYPNLISIHVLNRTVPERISLQQRRY